MAHVVSIAATSRALADVIATATPRLGILRLANGDAAVVTADTATRDGMPMIGNLAHVAWGTGAIIRAGGERVVVAWETMSSTRIARPGEACRLCGGAMEPAEAIAVCACEAPFHEPCSAVMTTCPQCGAAGGDGA